MVRLGALRELYLAFGHLEKEGWKEYEGKDIVLLLPGAGF